MKVEGKQVRVKGFGFRVQGAGCTWPCGWRIRHVKEASPLSNRPIEYTFRVEGLGFRVWGLGVGG